MSSYSLEYSMALFMNLCLNSKAIDIFREERATIVNILINILNERYDFCLPYVTGALFNMLTDEVINEYAKEMNLADALEKQLKVIAFNMNFLNMNIKLFIL